jgi:hypothetical protein
MLDAPAFHHQTPYHDHNCRDDQRSDASSKNFSAEAIRLEYSVNNKKEIDH